MTSPRKTLRYRLTLAFLLWTAGIQLAVAGVFVLGREIFVVDSIDRALTDAADRLRRGLIADPTWPPNLDQAAFLLQNEPNAPLLPVVMRARELKRDRRQKDPEWSTIARWPERNPTLEFAPPVSGDAPRHIEFTTLRLSAQSDEDDTVGPVRFRCASMDIHTVEGADYRLDFGASMELADRFTSAMGRILMAGLAVGIVGAGVAGWIVAGRASRRIVRIASEVEAVLPTRLEAASTLPTGEDEIGRMGEAVNGMLHRLASAFRSQEYFISNVAHELKTPIASMLAEAQVLKHSDPDPEHVGRFVRNVEEETRRLGALVETFLAMARFSEGHQGRADALVSINETAVESAQHCDLFARQMGVGVRLNLAEPEDHAAEPIVRGDAHLLRVAIDNLLRNAIGVSQQGDTVDVNVSMADRTVSLRVTDRGPGVPPGFVDRMFDRFAQRPDRRIGSRGTGLGLNIAKTIVDLHGGKIEVANGPEVGAVFTIRLPTLDKGEAGGQPESSGTSASGPRSGA